MEVSVSQFRAQLKDHLAKVKEGETIVITERGVPVARLVGVEGAGLLEQLERDGLITAPSAERAPAPEITGARPTASGSGVSGLLKRLRR
ncbi:MAG: type II toxin-antitoxin system prevent-host-death family antitoxin [Micrococcales bacterium]|nr:type II toxin-antitoxin system prevent-host-death family antitoxin [Micrococcales bacterium]